jgi:hypothetical protein
MRGLGLATIATATGVALLGAVPAEAAAAGVVPSVPAGAAAASGWRVVPAPPSGGGFFNAVSAQADNDAWAVGDLGATMPLTAHWNGTAWSQVPGPTITGATNTVLNAVSAPAASDVWAVGRTTQSLVTSSLAIHWDGTAWSVVATPHVAGSVLTSVAGITPTDAYAIGQTEALHWNGTAWSAFAVPTPGGATLSGLDAVAGDSASNVWITGLYVNTAKSALEPFAAHWNGTAWADVRMLANGAEFFGLKAFGTADTWATGSTGHGKPITENWTGGSFGVVPNPVSGTPGALLSVTGTGPDAVTAVGRNSTVNGPTAAFILSWNGSAWTRVAVPKVGATEQLDSTSAALGGKVTWAFGRSTDSIGVVSNLTLRHG